HALPPVLLGGRPHRPAALLRSLAEGQRYRDHARAPGEAAHPQGRSWKLRMARGERVAARAHALDEVLPRAARERRRRDGRIARRRRAKKSELALLPGKRNEQ